MKIATFNINGIKARINALPEWLDDAQPDVVVLQEIKSVDEAFPRELFEDRGYNVETHGQKSFNGVAILSKLPLEDVRRGLPGDDSDEQARWIEATGVGKQAIRICGLYLPNGNPQPGPKFDYKLAWFEHLIRHAAELMESGHPVVLAGDFNVVPSDFDIYDTRSWKKDALLQPESRECFERLLRQGWVDALRQRFPDRRLYTFWDYFRQHWQRDAGLRIDHLLLGRRLAQGLQGR